MNKVLVIGIDSLDPKLLDMFSDDLPTFSDLRRNSPSFQLKSIFPIDSIPAWASVFTGMNPANHGLIYSFDVFQSSWNEILKIDKSTYEGRTFWDHASSAGKRVCIIFPLAVYPAWEVKGVFLSRSLTGKICAWPETLANDLGLDNFEILSGKHPGKKKLGNYVERARSITDEEARVTRQILSTQDWDLAFTFFGYLDIIQHFFWRYFDSSDPTYPGPNLYEDTIRNFYKLLDRIVGDLIEEVGDTCVIVMSDHGHGMRPPKTVNINEVLRRKGYLNSKANLNNPAPYLIEWFKRTILDIVHFLELDNLMLRMSKMGVLASITKDVYLSTSTIDMDTTVAHLSSFVGPKSYPYGGIEVIETNFADDGITYEELRDEIIQTLMEMRDPSNDQLLMNWACRREDVYEGTYIEKYPDILFELKEGYGVYWGIHTPLIGTAYEHNLASGGHKKDAVFMIKRSLPLNLCRKDMELMDIAPTILSLMGVNIDVDFEGQACVVPISDK